jgi:DNA-binding GntR family transcriptional regulator
MIVDERLGSLEEQVYASLEQDILSGELAKGQTVTENELSVRLGVSRTPIRGALRRLAEEGLVDTAPNRRATVVGISIEDLIDTYKIRMRLEGLSSALAAERMTDVVLSLVANK